MTLDRSNTKYKFSRKIQFISLLCIFTFQFLYQDSIILNNNQDSFQKNDFNQKGEKKNLNKLFSPSEAADSQVIGGLHLVFGQDEKGFLDNGEHYIANLYYDTFFHNYYNMIYLSIDNNSLISFEDFEVNSTLRTITDFSLPIDFQKVTETIIKHPFEDVYIKIQIRLHQTKKFFNFNFMVWSESLDYDKLELVYYHDIDVDGYDVNSDIVDGEWTNDDAFYDETNELIYAEDNRPQIDRYMGWTSPHPVDAWAVGSPIYNDFLDDITSNIFNNDTEITNTDIAMATRYSMTSLTANEIWTVPIIYGFGDSLSELQANTIDIKNEFIYDFSLLDFDVELSANPTLNATIYNGGQYEQTRTVSVTRISPGNEVIGSESVTLAPGEYKNVTFTNLNLIQGENNQLNVTINNIANDYTANDYLVKNFQYQNFLTMNVKDLDGINVQDLNVSLYNQSNGVFIESHYTNINGNVSFVNLPDDTYICNITLPSMNNVLVYEEEIDYDNSLLKYKDISTNLTTMDIHVQDVEGIPVYNASISIENSGGSEIVFESETNIDGDLTFFYLNGTYNINTTYFGYGKVLNLHYASNYILDGYILNVVDAPLTNFTFQLNTTSNNYLVGAKVDLYEYIDSDNLDFITYDIADSFGNVSFYWLSLLNYSISVTIVGEPTKIKHIGDLDPHGYDFLNYTNSPFTSYNNNELNVSLGSIVIEDYKTNLIFLNSLPIAYTWEDNIHFSFLMTVNNSMILEDPQWANETTIEIRNSENQIVYLGVGENNLGQIGLHEFILNTTEANLISGNFIPYTVTISAQFYAYDDPLPITFPFYLSTIQTKIDLSTSINSVYWKDNFTISATYSTIDNKPLTNANVTLSWSEYIENNQMIGYGNGTYYYILNSSIGTPGNHFITINANKENYKHIGDKRINIEIRKVPTIVNGTNYYNSMHSTYVTTQNMTLQYRFLDSYRNINIKDSKPTYFISNIDTKKNYSGGLTYNGSGIYIFDPITSRLPIGNYYGGITFFLDNYLTSTAIIQMEILPIPLYISFSGGISDDSEETFQSLEEYNIKRGELFNSVINATDLFGNSIQSYNISYVLTKEGQTWSGELEVDENGICRSNFPDINELGLYSLEITIQKANYTKESLKIYVNVIYPTYFGVSEPVFFVAIIALLAIIVGIVGYRTVSYMKIPQYIKDLNKLEIILKNSKKTLPANYLSRDKQISQEYSDRWNNIDVEFPLKSQDNEISLFINEYRSITGKIMMNEDAKKYLNGLTIYSENEIKSQLESEHISGENLTRLMEIITKYIQRMNSENVLVDESNISEDQFDIDFDKIENEQGDEK